MKALNEVITYCLNMVFDLFQVKPNHVAIRMKALYEFIQMVQFCVMTGHLSHKTRHSSCKRVVLYCTGRSSFSDTRSSSHQYKICTTNYSIERVNSSSFLTIFFYLTATGDLSNFSHLSSCAHWVRRVSANSYRKPLQHY